MEMLFNHQVDVDARNGVGDHHTSLARAYCDSLILGRKYRTSSGKLEWLSLRNRDASR